MIDRFQSFHRILPAFMESPTSNNPHGSKPGPIQGPHPHNRVGALSVHGRRGPCHPLTSQGFTPCIYLHHHKSNKSSMVTGVMSSLHYYSLKLPVHTRTFEVQNQGEYQYMTLQRNYVHKLNKIFMLIVFPHLN